MGDQAVYSSFVPPILSAIICLIHELEQNTKVSRTSLLGMVPMAGLLTPTGFQGPFPSASVKARFGRDVKAMIGLSRDNSRCQTKKVP